ncbi:uncharacterized protein LOC132613978 [Lycium barbarum]|uniref:uncharacterized protein LOC132613978 n=1 Tax=Lycium barbarum TaxID=112863 RepID=UPI00293E7ACA|nr:uncharacterized protein LOC132613978 [Lycium barbarum]
MGEGNGQKEKMAREKNAEKMKDQKGSQLEANEEGREYPVQVQEKNFVPSLRKALKDATIDKDVAVAARVHFILKKGFTEAPPLTPGYDTSRGFSQLPTGSQWATSSGTPTATPSPTVSHHSSASTARFGVDGLHLGGSSSEPDNRTIDENLPVGGVVAPLLKHYDASGRLIIEPVGYSFLPDKASRILSRTIQGFFTDSPTWGKVEPDQKRQSYLTFKRKCFCLPEHEAHVAQNFEKKAGRLLKGALGRVREEQAKPDWIRPEAYNKLLQYWASDEFKKQSETGKKARNSTKGGSLHTSGAKSQVAVRKELELKEKRILPQDEAFKITHVKKKKNSEEPDEWVEERAKQSYIQFQQSRAELCSSLPPGIEPTDEQLNELWMVTVGCPTRFGTTYGMENTAFRKFQSPLQGIGSSNDVGSSNRASIMAMEQKIVELSIQL